MRSEGHIARMVEIKMDTFWKENVKRRDHLETAYLDTDAIIILKWISNKYDMWVWTQFISLWIGPLADACAHGDEPLGPVKDRKFLDRMKDC
jgi:hypothetical protein